MGCNPENNHKFRDTVWMDTVMISSSILLWISMWWITKKIKNHVKSVHEKIQCGKCLYKTFNMKNFTTHKREIHHEKQRTDQKPMVSHVTNASLIQTWNSICKINHIVSCIGQPNTQGCDKCNFKSDKKNYMDKHIYLDHC